MTMWRGFIWIIIVSDVGLFYQYGNDYADSTKLGQLLE